MNALRRLAANGLLRSVKKRFILLSHGAPVDEAVFQLAKRCGREAALANLVVGVEIERAVTNVARVLGGAGEQVPANTPTCTFGHERPSGCYILFNIASFYGSSCAINGKDALNTPDVI
eukprot:633988-Prorocentrum_minimum.AAC.2